MYNTYGISHTYYIVFLLEINNQNRVRILAKKKRRRKKKINQKMIKKYIKVGSIAAAICLTFLVGLQIPKMISEDNQSIQMNKEYIPGEEVANSLNKNEFIETKNKEQEATEVETLESDQTLIVISDKLQVDELSDNQEIIQEPEKGEEEQMSSDMLLENENNDMGLNELNEDLTVDEPNNNTQSNNQSASDKNGESLESIDTSDIIIPEGLTEEEQIQYVKDQWVNDMIVENKLNIEETDLNQGSTIYNKLDTAYLFQLAENGLTEEERLEVMAYLELNLMPNEIARAQELYEKYIGLVN